MTESYPYQNIIHLWLLITFLLRLVYSVTSQLTRNKSASLPGAYKTSLDTSPPQKSLSLPCKQINSVANEVNGQLSSLLAYIQVSDYSTVGTAMYLVFLELGSHH